MKLGDEIVSDMKLQKDGIIYRVWISFQSLDNLLTDSYRS